MVVILVHWLIKSGMEQAFQSRWRQMSIEANSGLYREILTKIATRPSNPNFTHSVSAIPFIRHS